MYIEIDIGETIKNHCRKSTLYPVSSKNPTPTRLVGVHISVAVPPMDAV